MTENQPPAADPQAAVAAQQAQRAATPQEVMAAQRTLKRLRREIAKFHLFRHENNEVAAGMRAAIVTPQAAQAVLAERRDSQMEARAVAELRKVIAIVRGREPTQADMAELLPPGLEMGLGIWPQLALVGIAAIGGSAISYFAYLNAQEERIAEETRGPVASTLRAVSENVWAVVGLGGIAVFGLLYWDMRSKVKALGGGAMPWSRLGGAKGPDVRVRQLPEPRRAAPLSLLERAETRRRNAAEEDDDDEVDEDLDEDEEEEE